MPCFVNCSNHPQAHWPESQHEAALQLGHGQVVDFPDGLPNVPPTFTTAEVADLASRTVDQILLLDPAGAFIAGEFTLTLAITLALEALGIACYAATSERVVVETLAGSGVALKKSEFRFVKWRRYAVERSHLPAGFGGG